MSTGTTITTAQTEYYRRPKDERYPDLPTMIQVAKEDHRLSTERTMNWRDLKWGVHPDGDGIALFSSKGPATLTHWSFGQASTMLQAPAGFLREGLSPQLAADALNYRVSQQPHGTDANLLIRMPNGRPQPQIRSVNSKTYGRVWDDNLYASIQDRLGHKWTAPPVWEGGTGGIYRGDRDSFVILHEGGSIVTDPSAAGQNDQMFRAMLIRNSEVGAAAVSIETILYRYICGNHLLWGAVMGSQFRRRHVGEHAMRDTVREINRIAVAWCERSAQQDETIIRGLIDRQIATTRDGVIDELRAIGYTAADAADAYDTCEVKENVAPTSYWGIVQGTTRLAQVSGYQDERYALDKLAAAVLKKGRVLVAA
jgi:hypothetical protein